MKSKDLEDMVDEFLKKGGSIEQIPAGTSTERTLGDKKETVRTVYAKTRV